MPPALVPQLICGEMSVMQFFEGESSMEKETMEDGGQEQRNIRQ